MWTKFQKLKMPSTNEATLELIQREISEVVQREKELKEKYLQSELRNGGEKNGDTVPTNGELVNKEQPSNSIKKSNRLFTQNAATKGVMQRFIKSKGKLNLMSPGANNPIASPTQPFTNFVNFEVYEVTPVISTGMQTRNGFVPVNERIKQELSEIERRESELRSERRKSQPDMMLYVESELEEFDRTDFQTTRSISQVDYGRTKESVSSNTNLKPAKSLADLCNLEDEEVELPGSLSLIQQWENIIQRNQARP